MPDNDPMAQMMAAWKQASDTYLAAWNRALETMASMPGASEATQETSKTMLGSRAAANEVTRQAMEPMIELAGGVTMSEFRRLMDAVHGLHLRMDLIEDQLRALTPREPDAKKAKRKK